MLALHLLQICLVYIDTLMIQRVLIKCSATIGIGAILQR